MTSLRFILSANRRDHILRHFREHPLAGSYFDLSTFPSPDELLLFINSNAPISMESQSEKKACYLFHTIDGRAVGSSGIALRNSVLAENIVYEQREGYSLSIGLVEELPVTESLCVIAQETNEGLSVVTAFPGGCARPFAQKGQPAKEYALNKQFWEEHILLKKKN